MKRKISILITITFAFILTSYLTYAATKYVLTSSDYSVYVNGQAMQSNLPILDYQGSTYLPLRKIAETTNTNIEVIGNVIKLSSIGNSQSTQNTNSGNSLTGVKIVGSANENKGWCIAITGTLENNDSIEHEVKVTATCYDSNKTPITTQSSLPVTISPGNTEGFTINILNNISKIKDYVLKVQNY